MPDTKLDGEIPQEIRLFLESILEEADMLLLDEVEQEQILINMYGQLESHLIAKIMENLPDDKIEEFIDLNDEKAENRIKRIQAYLEKNLPNAREVFTQAFIEFRTMYLQNVAIEQARYEALVNNNEGNNQIDDLEKISLGTQNIQGA